MGRVGFTTTIPVEVLLAAGQEPVDLNNLLSAQTTRSKWLTRLKKPAIRVPPAAG